MDDERLGTTTGDPVGPEQGGGPPNALPWTMLVEDEGWAADLEHGALLPCVGDHVEFIAEDGERRVYVVTDIVHTVQPAASERPPVAAEERGPNAIVNDGRPHGPPGLLRVGLPRVVVRRET